MPKQIGILTSGGDCPGLNAAIRGVGKAARDVFRMELVGFRDGFRGLVHDRTMPLESNDALRHPHQRRNHPGHQPRQAAPDGDRRRDPRHDRRDRRHLRPQPSRRLGLHRRRRHPEKRPAPEGGRAECRHPAQDHRQRHRASTDVSLGFDTALGIATEAIDRLHSTATSHNRIIVVEVMGHRAGWLALGAGIAGGADVILIPEIPYDLERVAEAIRDRARAGKRFSIVAVAEGAMSADDARLVNEMLAEKQTAKSKGDKKKASAAAGQFPPTPSRTHGAADRATRKDDRPGVAIDDPGASSARRHAVAGRSSVGHASWGPVAPSFSIRTCTASCLRPAATALRRCPWKRWPARRNSFRSTIRGFKPPSWSASALGIELDYCKLPI